MVYSGLFLVCVLTCKCDLQKYTVHYYAVGIHFQVPRDSQVVKCAASRATHAPVGIWLNPVKMKVSFTLKTLEVFQLFELHKTTYMALAFF